MGDIFLSQKEARRAYVCEQVVSGTMTALDGAAALGIGYRQMLRMKRRVATEGLNGLPHRSRGRVCPRSTPQQSKDEIVRLAQSELKGCSYAHASELLAGRGICVGAKTVGRILKAAGIVSEHTHRSPRKYRSRNRRERFGELIQMDASPHAWLEDRGPRLSLHGAIDDARSYITGLCFMEQECTAGYLRVLEQTVKSHGIPQSVYTDRHTIFVSPEKDRLSVDQQLAGKTVNLTQFGRAINELSIGHILARSPQAKGRIERMWGTLQERLTAELRLAGISSLDEANRFLRDYIEGFNAQFAKEAASKEPAWRPAPPDCRLKTILCLKHERKSTAGSSFSFGGRLWQLTDGNGKVTKLNRGQTITVRLHLDGSSSAAVGATQFAMQAAPR